MGRCALVLFSDFQFAVCVVLACCVVFFIYFLFCYFFFIFLFIIISELVVAPLCPCIISLFRTGCTHLYARECIRNGEVTNWQIYILCESVNSIDKHYLTFSICMVGWSVGRSVCRLLALAHAGKNRRT